MNKINQTITAHGQVEGAADIWLPSPGLGGALEELERGNIGAAVVAASHWLSARALDGDTARDIAYFEIRRARKLRQNGDFEAAAAALRGVSLNNASPSLLIEEATLIGQGSGNSRLLAEYLISALLINRFAEVDSALRSVIKTGALTDIVNAITPAEAASVVRRVKSAVLVGICSSEAWQTLGLLFERAELSGSRLNLTKQLTSALNMAVIGEYPRPSIIRLLAVIGSVYNPIAEGLSVPDFLAKALSAAHHSLVRLKGDAAANGNSEDLLADAIATGLDASDPLATTRALWLALSRLMLASDGAVPKSVREALNQLMNLPGPHQAEASVLNGILLGESKLELPDPLRRPRVLVAAHALKAADSAIAANKEKLAKEHLAAAKNHGAARQAIFLRSAALAVAVPKPAAYLAELQDAALEGQLSDVLHAIVAMHGSKVAAKLAALLPDSAISQPSLWKAPLIASIPNGEALLEILLERLVASRDLSPEAAVGVLKHQLANQPRSIQSKFLKPALQLSSRCAEADPEAVVKLAGPLLAKIIVNVSTPEHGGPLVDRGERLGGWSKAKESVSSTALLCGVAKALVGSEALDAQAKSAIADDLLKHLASSARDGADWKLDDRGIAAVITAASDMQAAFEFIESRAAAGAVAAYAGIIDSEIVSCVRRLDIQRANRLLAYLNAVEPIPPVARMRRLILDLLAGGETGRLAVSRIATDGFLEFLDQVARDIGGATALRFLDLVPASRIAKPQEWQRLAKQRDVFGTAGDVLDAVLDRLPLAGKIEVATISIASRIAFSAGHKTKRPGFLSKLIGIAGQNARRSGKPKSEAYCKAANNLIASFYTAECGHAPSVDDTWNVLSRLQPDPALLAHYREAVLAGVKQEKVIGHSLAEHASRALNLGNRVPESERTPPHAADDVFLAAASGDVASLKDRLAVLAAMAPSGKDDATIAAAAKFCLLHCADPAVRGVALDILWRSKIEIATVLAAIWNVHPARFFEAVNWLTAKNQLATMVMQAAEQLTDIERRQFFEALPIAALRRKSQWSAAALVLAAKRNFEGTYALVAFMAERAIAGSPEALATLELAAKALLPRLSDTQNHLLAFTLMPVLARLPAGIRSPTLLKATKPFSGVRDLEKIATRSFAGGDRRTAVAAAEAIAVSGRLNHERLAQFVDIMIEFGETGRAERMVVSHQAAKPHTRNLMHLLRIALVEGDQAKIASAANAIVKAKEAVAPRRFDFPLSRLSSQRHSSRLKRALSLALGVNKAKRRLEDAGALLRARTVVGDIEGARRLVSRMSGRGMLSLPVDEVGFLIQHSDFSAAESKLGELIGAALRRQRIMARARQPLRLILIDRAAEYAYLIQRYLMNQGRDVSFLAKFEELVLAALHSPWRSKLSKVAEERLFTVGLTLLRIRLHSTEPELPVMRELARQLELLAKSRVDRQIRLSQQLLQGWQAEGGRHVDQAIESLTREMRFLTAKAGGGAKKLTLEIAEKQFSELRAAGFSSLDRKQAAALAKLLDTGLNLSNQQSAFEVFDDLLITARALLGHAASKKWFAIPVLQALARRVRDIAPEVPQALDFLLAADDGITSDKRYLALMAAAMISTGSSNDALRYVNRGLAAFPNNTVLLQLAVQVYGNLGNTQLARETAIRLAALSKSRAIMELGRPSRIRDGLEIGNTLAQFGFWADTSKVMQKVPPPRRAAPKGVVFASFYKCMASASITTMPFLELKKRGYDVVYLNSGTIDAEPTGHPVLDRFRGILQVDGSIISGMDVSSSTYIADWNIDWNNRRIEADGINFYQPIFERLTQQSRTYSINVQDAQVGRQIKGMIRVLDRALHVAKLIRAEVCSLGIPVRFASSNWQYPPYAAFRIVCDAWKHDCDIGFVAVSPGYESYYANLGKLYATTAAAVNMTHNAESRAPFLPIREKFERWFAANHRDTPALDTEVKKWIATDRAGVGRELPQEAMAVVDRVRRFRAGGGKVIAVFGKIVYDLAVPYAGGPAHTDMKDFLNHTVASAARSNVLVLIKPHPHELRYEIARNPREYFTDMIEMKIPDNVILLGHRWFNVRDMIEMIDLGVLWNGTTGVELGASGIPVVMCDDWGPRDYPVGHFAPKDRAHYEQIIRDPTLVKMPDGYPEKCAALLKYLSTDDVMRPYPFVKRGLVNVDVGPPVWDFAEVDRYMQEGDKYVSALADDFKFKDEKDV